jgi:hypothetical protein
VSREEPDLAEGRPPRLEGLPAPPAPAPAPVRAPAGTAEATRESRGDPYVAGWIDVTVPMPEGAVPGPGTVYALPARNAGADDAAAVPHVDTDTDTGDAYALPVPQAGRWDVGYAGVWGHALATDVLVRAGGRTPVRLVLPRLAPITFRMEDRDALAWAESHGAHVRCDSTETGEGPSLPGRGETGHTSALALLKDASVVRTRPLPTDGAYDVTLSYHARVNAGRPDSVAAHLPYPAWKLRLDRQRARPGEELAVALRRQAVLDVHLQVDGPASRLWAGDVHPVVEVVAQAGAMESERRYARMWAEAPHIRGEILPLHVDEGLVRVVWKGAAVLDGVTDPFQVVGGETRRVDVDLALNPEFTPSAPVPPLRVRFRGDRLAEADHETCVYAADSGAPGRDVAENSFYGKDAVELEPDAWRGVHEVGGIEGWNRIAPPAAIDPRTGEATLTFERGGHLLVVPDGWVDARLGSRTLRRADGRPCPVTWTAEGGRPSGCTVDRVVPTSPGTLIGPLPPGTHAFDIRIGSAVVGRVQGTVGAGKIGLLRLPR